MATLIPLFNHERCTRCGLCVEICPREVLYIEEDALRISTDECMLCTHCYTVCPEDAISFDEEIIFEPAFSFSDKNGQVDTKSQQLADIVQRRRSIRSYREEPVEQEVLDYLVNFAVTAPSGTNDQKWEFCVVNGREKVWDLALTIGNFFQRINRLAANPFFRFISPLFAGNTFKDYYRERYERVEKALDDSRRGIDQLFWSAPALIVIHSSMDGSTPVEDGILAAYNILLMAHTLGLGTCLIGYAVEAFKHDASLKDYLGIPRSNRVHAVITAGYPKIQHQQKALRKRFLYEKK